MKKDKNILVVDDESSMRKNINDILTIEGYNVFEAENGVIGIEKVVNNKLDLVLLDFNMPLMDGFETLSEIKKINPDLPVIILTAYGTNERIIETMKSGAYDYMDKPFELAEFLIVVERAIKYFELITELKKLRTSASENVAIYDKEQIIGKSSTIKEILKLLGLAAPSDATVLIQGESGTGKELIADAIQRHSLRRERPYVKINCGAFSESLLESEIFGHEKGSFTGAVAQKLGMFELANDGTVFLDEINNMPQSVQIRLLRILQHQTFYRVGGEIPVPTNIRIIAASNKNIEREVEEGRLRKDLYYRLNVIRINIPPLRERTEDIPLLVEHFLNKYGADKNLVITPENIERLRIYLWPGNIRELENNIQRALVFARDNIVNIETEVKEEKAEVPENSFQKILKEGLSFKSVIEEIEKNFILQALKITKWNRTETAKLLKIHRRLLYNKMKEYKLNSFIKNGLE
jgi:two-component system, NtrC family, response regulator AtoC